jgi:hypothetical protein
MSVDFDRRLQGSQQYGTGVRTMAAATYGARLPLQQSRHQYTQQPSGLSSSGEGCTTSAAMNRFSTLESSNNENNKARIQSFSSSNHQRNSQHYYGRTQDKNSSTLDEVAGPILGNVASVGSTNPKPARSESVGRAERGRSTSAQGCPSQRATSAVRATADGNNSDNESVIIEEKRRRVNGDGYTLHRYLRGRLLGRGGFAKVYLCTALDTSKNYAVKIVPKANLVKSRARQKVRSLHKDGSVVDILCVRFCY